MKEIRNITRAPLKVHLPGGKVLHLGPGHTGQVSNEALEHHSVRKLLEAGQLEIAGDGHHDESGAPSGGSHEETHGHHPTAVVRPKGDR